MPRLLILTGPSCVGKSPLLHALEQSYPDLAQGLQKIVLYNDRQPRPGETDGVTYHFRPRDYLETLRSNPDFIVMPVRRDLQALYLPEISQILEAGSNAFFEGNVHMAGELLRAPILVSLPKLSCLLSPVTAQELAQLRAEAADVREVICELMRQKLIHRATRQKGALTADDHADIEARCGAAWEELQCAPWFDWVIPNHDGEGTPNWDPPGRPRGEALRALQAFVALLRGERAALAERWTAATLKA